MKPLDYYQMKEPLPKKADYTTYQVYGEKKLLLETPRLSEAEDFRDQKAKMGIPTTMLKIQDTEKYTEETKKWKNKYAQLEQEYEKDILEEVLLSSHPRAHELYTFAKNYASNRDLLGEMLFDLANALS